MKRLALGIGRNSHLLVMLVVFYFYTGSAESSTSALPIHVFAPAQMLEASEGDRAIIHLSRAAQTVGVPLAGHVGVSIMRTTNLALPSAENNSLLNSGLVSGMRIALSFVQAGEPLCSAD